MRRKPIFALLVLNGLIATLLFSPVANTQIIPRAIFDCCKVDLAFQDYCCSSCCWLIPNCDDNEDCQPRSPSPSSGD